MPTGYTSVLFDKPETTFSEFASRCARAFGACMAMRDESLAVALPDEVKRGLSCELRRCSWRRGLALARAFARAGGG